MGRSTLYFLLFCCLFLVVSKIKHRYYDQNYMNSGNTVVLGNGQTKREAKEPLRLVSEFSQQVDDEWIPVMKTGVILYCAPYKAFDAYADKFIIELEGGYKAMIKLMEKQSLFDRALQTIFYDPVQNEGTMRAEAGGYQAMPELAAWHVDRILGFYRKPPITSRMVSYKMLYGNFLLSLLPDFMIPVTVHGWVDQLEDHDPSPLLMQYLVLNNIQVPTSDATKQLILQISDVLVFDFLVDDHDRQAEKNWVLRGDQYLTWDNGLGWHHGPYGAPSCLDILCGSNKWRRHTGFDKPCKRTCVFRNSTVELLKRIGGPDSLEQNQLGNRLQEELKNLDSIVSPLFHFGVYYSDFTKTEMIRYDTESFFVGLNGRAAKLLEHIDNCIQKHGVDIVILDV